MSAFDRFCCRSRRLRMFGACPGFLEWRLILPFCSTEGYRSANTIRRNRQTTGGGLATNFARRRRFCAMAASVNSSCASRGPRNRSRREARQPAACLYRSMSDNRHWQICATCAGRLARVEGLKQLAIEVRELKDAHRELIRGLGRQWLRVLVGPTGLVLEGFKSVFRLHSNQTAHLIKSHGLEGTFFRHPLWFAKFTEVIDIP
jgi:hypothetical protein